MTTWVICGAGRGVGKTHLARRLCEILPGAVYAKCGHGTPEPGGPENFFRTKAKLDAFLASLRESVQHVVVESGAMAREGEGDVIIFLDGIDAVTDVRDDVGQLRANAHVKVSTGVAVRDWKRALRGKVAEAARSGLRRTRRAKTLPGRGVACGSDQGVVYRGRHARVRIGTGKASGGHRALRNTQPRRRGFRDELPPRVEALEERREALRQETHPPAGGRRRRGRNGSKR